MRRVYRTALRQSFRDLSSTTYHTALKVRFQSTAHRTASDSAIDVDLIKPTDYNRELASHSARTNPALQRLIETFVLASNTQTSSQSPTKRYGKAHQNSLDGKKEVQWPLSRSTSIGESTRQLNLHFHDQSVDGAARKNRQLNISFEYPGQIKSNEVVRGARFNVAPKSYQETLHFNPNDESSVAKEPANEGSPEPGLSWTQHSSLWKRLDHVPLWTKTGDMALTPYHHLLKLDSDKPVNFITTEPDSLWSAHSNLLSTALKAQERGETLDAFVILDSIWKFLPELITSHYNRSLGDDIYQSFKTQFLAVWSFTMQTYGVKLFDNEGQDIDWEKALIFAQTTFSDSMNVQNRFKVIFPLCSEDATDQLAIAATATFSYLILDPKNLPKDDKFIRFLACLLNGTGDFYRVTKRRLRKSRFGPAGRFLQRSLSGPAGQFLRVLKDHKRHAEIVISSSTTAYPSTLQLVHHFKRKLLRDLKMGVTGRLAETLREWTITFRVFCNHWKSQQDTRYVKSSLARALIKAAYKDGNVQNVNDIWREVLSEGYIPGMEDFTLRMVGAGKLRQLSEVEKYWNILCANWRPDQWAVGARIVAYIDCDEPEKATDLFTEHVNTWIRAATQQGLDISDTGDLPGVPKFRTKTINTILTALCQKGYKSFMNKVVHLAQGMGVKLDRMTFNTLINAADVEGSDAALKVVGEMIKSGIRPGRTTFNILINSIYRHGQDSKEVEWDKVKKLLDYMESNNIPVGRDTLATCLKLVLWKFNDLETALQVLEDATNRFGSVDHVIATVLINHMFTNPTEENIATIKNLWNNAWRDKVDADSILWEEMAKGYASINEIHRMCEILGGMLAKKMKFRWQVLFECLKAAIHNKKWQDARRVVKIARVSKGGKLNESAIEEDFQEQFWRLASVHGVSTVEKWKMVESEMGIRREYHGLSRSFNRVELEVLDTKQE